jgi:HPt (histidine-containing phosphotransfer) domain-containing protein
MNLFPRHRRRQAAIPAGAGAAPDVLDAATLARLRQLDPEGRRGFVNQVLRTYEAALVRHLATLDEAGAQADLQRAGEVAHTLKSSSASIGALGFAQSCTVVEQLARAGDASALGAPLVTLRAEGARVLAAVRAILPD